MYANIIYYYSGFFTVAVSRINLSAIIFSPENHLSLNSFFPLHLVFFSTIILIELPLFRIPLGCHSYIFFGSLLPNMAVLINYLAAKTSVKASSTSIICQMASFLMWSRSVTKYNVIC